VNISEQFYKEQNVASMQSSNGAREFEAEVYNKPKINPAMVE